jgi:hypothetical protein
VTEKLALPDPQTVAAAEVPALIRQATELRQLFRADRDDRIVEVYDRLGAIRRYVRDREANQALEIEERRVEVAIGDLLGPAADEKGGRGKKAKSPNGVRSFKDPLIHAFRTMVEHEDLVELALTRDPPVTKRAKILRFIRRELQPRAAGDWQLIHSAIADLQVEDVDVIVTDPPYPREYLPQWRELRDFASRSLRPGGSLFALSGQSWLPEVFERMGGDDSLGYQWTMAYLLPGSTAIQFGPRAMNAFKPVLWYVKGDYDGQIIHDVFKSDIAEKESHDWGQSESGFADIVKRCTEPGDLIVDPFVGGGTTAVVSVQLGRRFIGADIDAEALKEAERRLG